MFSREFWLRVRASTGIQRELELAPEGSLKSELRPVGGDALGEAFAATVLFRRMVLTP